MFRTNIDLNCELLMNQTEVNFVSGPLMCICLLELFLNAEQIVAKLPFTCSPILVQAVEHLFESLLAAALTWSHAQNPEWALRLQLCSEFIFSSEVDKQLLQYRPHKHSKPVLRACSLWLSPLCESLCTFLHLSDYSIWLQICKETFIHESNKLSM